MTSITLQPDMTRTDWVLLTIPGIIWGSSFFLIAEGLEVFPPQLITPMRIFFGFLALICFPASRVPVPREAFPRIALLGTMWMAIPLTMFPFAEQHVSSSVTGMLNGATPFFVAGVASIIAHKLPTRKQLLGLAIGFSGVVFIAVPTAREGSNSASGVAMIFVALACYGVALNISVGLQRQYGALPIIVRAQAFALILTAPFGIASLPDASFSWSAFSAMIVLGIGGTGIAYFMAVTLAGKVGSTRTSVTTYIMPVVALFLGVALRNEPVSLLALVGCALALGGAYATNRT
jgi:drug/metabolite transporter (DMT)-like permease